jgi:hypothetical protein
MYSEYADIDNNLAGLAWKILSSAALSDMGFSWKREIFAVSRDSRRFSVEVESLGRTSVNDWAIWTLRMERDGSHSHLRSVASSLAPFSSTPARDRSRPVPSIITNPQ